MSVRHWGSSTTRAPWVPGNLVENSTWHANRGAITLAVTLEGREAHSGRAHEGVNAFEAMLDVAAPLRELAQQLRTRRTA